MNRREFLAGVAGAGSVGGLGLGVWFTVGGNADSSSDSHAGHDHSHSKSKSESPDVPPKVKQAKPLATDFHSKISEFYPGSRVFITGSSDGPVEISMEYATSASSKGGLEAELHRIADQYATVVRNGDHRPLTLSMVTGKVQAIAPRPTVKAYVEGRINKKAYLKTIEITDVKRNN